MAFLPPSSQETFFISCPQRPATWRPTSLEPVSEIIETRGSSTMALPTLLPEPVTRLSTPGGRPASFKISTNIKAQSGVSDAGLITTVLPATRAGKIFHEGIAIGKFHGVIRPTTPRGCLTDMANFIGNSLGPV